MGNIIDNVKRQTQQLKNDVTRSGGIYYKGTLNKTQSGRQCQRWVDQWPHGHSRTPWNYPGKGLGAHNYCRNPDGEPQIWCYTNDRNSRWEFCNTNTAKQMIENDGNTKIRKIEEEKRKKLEQLQQKKLEQLRQKKLAAIRRENERKEHERIQKIKEEEERKRLAEERRIQSIRNEKHNKHWNQTGKNQTRTFECDDVNGNKLGGKNLYLDDGGIIYANEKSIALSAAQMKETVKTRKLSDGRPNPNWTKHKLSSGNPQNFLYPYDSHTNEGDKIEHNGISLVSNNHIFKLEMTKEGNLVLKKTISGCTGNYTKTEDKGDYKAFKTDASKLMNEYIFIDSADKKIQNISNEMLTNDKTYKYIGEFQPENDNNMVLVKDKEECFKKGNADDTCEHIYYVESKTGNNYCGIRTGMPDKYIPIQPNGNIKKSSLYIKNKKMKELEVGKNVPQSHLYILDKYNKTLPNREVQQLSNYTAYSDYEINNKPITEYQELLGSKVAELQANQRKMFEGFKNSSEKPENMPVNDFINDHQIKPLQEKETQFISSLDKINQNYTKLSNEISSIKNNDETGLRDKLESENKYNSYLSVELEKTKDVSDVRLDDTKDLIEHNNSIFNLGVVTASTLLVASILIARE